MVHTTCSFQKLRVIGNITESSAAYYTEKASCLAVIGNGLARRTKISFIVHRGKLAIWRPGAHAVEARLRGCKLCVCMVLKFTCLIRTCTQGLKMN